MSVFVDSINTAKFSHIHRVSGHEFSVAHYTGKLTYDARDLADKNRDFLPPEMVSDNLNSIIKKCFHNVSSYVLYFRSRQCERRPIRQ